MSRAAAGSPSVFSVPSGAPFLHVLAQDLLSGGHLPGGSGCAFGLADVRILLPTRRACRELSRILIEANGGEPLLLPRISAIGDVDPAEALLDPEAAADYPDPQQVPGLAPTLDGLERQLLASRLVQRWGASLSPALRELWSDEAPVIPGSPAMAARLAAELCRLMDALETEEIAATALNDLVPGEHARYWELSLDFLKIIAEAWPQVLRERGAVSPVARRNLLLAQEAERLSRGSAEPVIAAGSTGSLPATARLLKTIAWMDNGALVLPGLDQQIDAAAWTEIAATPSHPQHGLALLLAQLGIERGEVAELGGHRVSERAGARQRLAGEAMRPHTTTGAWRELGAQSQSLGPAVQELTLIEAASEEEEALAIALVLRESLERPGSSAALITPDRGLARRVQAELARWNITIDDSAGVPLANTAPGTLARLTADLLTHALAPVPLLALLKHPLVRLGGSPGAARRAARMLELAALRGPRPEPTFEGLALALKTAKTGAGGEPIDVADAEALLEDLRGAIGGFIDLPSPLPLGEAVACHRFACEQLARGDQPAAGADGEALYDGEAGKVLAALFDELQAAAAHADWRIEAGDYPAVFDAFMAGRPVRPRPTQGAQGGRLHIWGPLEARLMRADTVVLGSLNEGSWPMQSATDPWLSRGLRGAIGLSPPERRIGLAAHDFAQSFASERVVLTRSVKSQGSPTVASRWLHRLRAVLGALDAADRAIAAGAAWLRLARGLDAPASWAPVPPPAPRPPVAARPRRLSVTEVETLIRDPYAIYARRILGLRPLDPLDAPPDAAERGSLIHRAMQRFVAEDGPRHGQAGEARLLAIGEELFGTLADAVEIKGFWRARFARAAGWFVEEVPQLEEGAAAFACEVAGELRWDAPGGDFLLHGRADRIDLGADGRLRIYDYKTGRAPSDKQVAAGVAPQLALEAALAENGGFDTGWSARAVSRLAFIELTGGEVPGRIVKVDTRPAPELAAEALDELKRRVAAYDQEAQAYHPRLMPMFDRFVGDYDHLARVREWSRREPGDAS